MGLLDDLLAQVAGGSPRTASAPRADASGGTSMGSIVSALLPVVMAMLAGNSSGSGSSAGARASAGGGGLGDVLGQILGGGGGTSRGGLGGLLEQFRRAGFGAQADSWVGTGQNQPVSPEDMGQIFGQGGLSEIARRAGLTEQQASEGLSRILPDVVDRVTPSGEVPADDSLVASVDSLTRRLGLR
jgi:uncharacterized protein YidB (DUF937 family)